MIFARDGFGGFRASLKEEDDGEEGRDDFEATMFPGQVMVS